MNAHRHGAIADPPHVIPEESRVTREALELLAATWRAAVGDAREIWERDGQAVLDLLLAARNEGALKGTPYQALKIESIWAAQTDRLLADLTLPISDNKELPQLLRFTRDVLEEKTNDRHRTPRHPFFDACSRVSDCNDDLQAALRDHQITFERELITTVATELHARKEELGQQSYDDLLAQLSRALEGPGGERLARKLRMDYRVALVDEFQDTDQLQYSILSKIWCGEQSTLFLIGDPKQAIYAFRGADVHAYLGAKRDAGERCYTLATNWRSDPAMIEGVGALFARAQSPFGDEGIPFGTVSARPDARNELEDPTGEPRAAALDLLFYARADDKLVRKEVAEADLPWRVAADIARLLRGGARIESRDVRPGDIAVLCRTNAQTNAICRALREVGVPAALLGTASVFDTDEAQELEWVLDAIA
ncbi:MAG: UvrD-helicase domain-containing protein, partial [bacterium]|nr:UvrD-helicase domain-containing protein [bacterium]